MPFPLIPAGTKAGGYTIAKSLRFRSSASAYLSRTPGSAGSTQTVTFSAWVKVGTLGTTRTLFSAGTGSTAQSYLQINSSDKLVWYSMDGGVLRTNLTTTQVFRDPSAWYHIVAVYNETNGTSGDRARLYVNGVRISAFDTATYPPGAAGTYWNSTNAHSLSRDSWQAANYFDGYVSEINWIDGQALDPTSFGQTDTATGVWMPKAYTGSYGTNGFYLKFADASGATATTIGKDSSGNGNNWTPNNISVTAGVTYDSMYDTPTNYDNGVTGAGNYATLNPVFPSGGTYSNANLKFVGPTAWANARSTVELPSSGKWYFEATVIANGQNNTLGSSYSYVGVTATSTTPSALGYNGANFVTLTDTGWLNNNATTSNAVGAALAANNLIGIAIDVDNNTFTFYRTNSSVASGTIGMSAGTPLVFVNGSYSATYGNFDVNFGQRPFTYTPPTGFKALCTQNLPTPTIGATSSTLANKYFDATLWTGDGTVPRPLTNSGLMQPDLVWVKARGSSTFSDHVLNDAVRGATKDLYSNLTAAEALNNSVMSFNSNGFSVGDSSRVNQSSIAYVGWQWKANGSGSSNTSGTITSTVSANVTAGFSVVTYTGTGANATVGHGLGVAPKLIIVKIRNSAVVADWAVYHASLGGTQLIRLDTTGATISSATAWNNTAPTSSVFSVGTLADTNYSASATYVAYCFAEVAGYSKFGSYTGNGSADGPFVYCGFRPKYIMLKRTDTAGTDWVLWDTARSTYNVTNLYLAANTSGAEGTYANDQIDILSNGFKQRGTASGENASGGTYIYAAFAESPFNYARAR